MKPIKGKACGKFILLGEHFVIGNGTSSTPALAFPLPELWCEVTVTPNEHQHYSAKFVGGQAQEIPAGIEALMARATYAAADSLRIDITAQAFSIESVANFPVSKGFGSSAAFSVALARALDGYRKYIINESAAWDELQKATFAIEKIFHGSPSGVDTSVILAGRPIRFENGSILREIVNRAVDFVVVDSGNRDECAELIKQVASFRARDPRQWERMADAIRVLVDQCETALEKGKADDVAKTVREAHGILSELGLSSASIDDVLRDGHELGALAGKVSGAGGGGAVVLVTRKGEGRNLSAAMQGRGHSVVAVEAARV